MKFYLNSRIITLLLAPNMSNYEILDDYPITVRSPKGRGRE